MSGKFVPKFNIAGIIADVSDKIKRLENVVIDRLQQIGEQFIIDARSEPSKWIYTQVKLGKGSVDGKGNKIKRYYRNGKAYTRTQGQGESFSDWTENLRSSIGYIIYKDGQPFDTVFPGEGPTGVKAGMQTAKKADVPKKGFALVLVAGMNYALYVEAKGYDVITGSTFTAEKELKRTLELIRKNLNGITLNQ